MVIKVTCALIEQHGRVLVTQRSEKMAQPMLWEFPGGKLEEGETEIDCLKREIHEELNLGITPVKRLQPVRHQYGDKTIELIPYISQYNSGVIRLNEHRSYHWIKPEELQAYDWCPADLPVVGEYLKLRAVTPDEKV